MNDEITGEPITADERKGYAKMAFVLVLACVFGVAGIASGWSLEFILALLGVFGTGVLIQNPITKKV